MTASENQTSAEVQREAEAERAGLVNTLDQLRETSSQPTLLMR